MHTTMESPDTTIETRDETISRVPTDGAYERMLYRLQEVVDESGTLSDRRCPACKRAIMPRQDVALKGSRIVHKACL